VLNDFTRLRPTHRSLSMQFASSRNVHLEEICKNTLASRKIAIPNSVLLLEAE